MISNRFDENLTARLYQEYSAKKHKEKLKEIKKRNWSMSFEYEPEEPSQKPHSYLKLSKLKEVVRENTILYNRLTIISERKLHNHPSPSQHSPRTLNFAVRKKNSERIVKENNSFIQRLIDRPSQFSVKKMRAEFETHQKYKENLSKQKIFQRIEKLFKAKPINPLNPFSPFSPLNPAKSKQEISVDSKKLRQSESVPDISS